MRGRAWNKGDSRDNSKNYIYTTIKVAHDPNTIQENCVEKKLELGHFYVGFTEDHAAVTRYDEYITNAIL
jgi:hypothetical protein